MKIPRILPYLIGLIVLAFALGSLTRGTPGGSLLFRSYWLLYLFYLGPVIVLGAMIAVITLIGLSYRDIGAAIGFQIARRRRTAPKRRWYTILVQGLFWALAIGVLISYKGSIFNPIHATNSTITEIVGKNGTAPSPLQTGDFLPALSNLVQNTWFSLAFLGLIVVGGLILVESYRIALKEAREARFLDLRENQEQGLQAVHEAIRLIEDPASDPRSRIIACYQHLLATVSRLGAPISSDLTARELDRSVRSTLALKGPATSELTKLFEEARYSLHEIKDSDADAAHKHLESVAEELKIQLETEN